MNKKAFTLIELLVVVLIIGILSAIALPQYQKAVEKSRSAEALNNLSSLQQAIDAYVLQNGYGSAHFTKATNPDLLDVDITNGLTCDDGMMACHSKYFWYRVYCTGSDCQIHAVRRGARGGAAYIWNQDPIAYDLALIKNRNEKGKWSKTCTYDAGGEMCFALQSQGFTPHYEK